jgi:hypothetical protein
MVLGREVPFPRVDLDRDAELGPPHVGLGDEVITGVDHRVEQRHRQPGSGQQVLQIPLRGRPDPVGDVGQRLPE